MVHREEVAMLDASLMLPSRCVLAKQTNKQTKMVCDIVGRADAESSDRLSSTQNIPIANLISSFQINHLNDSEASLSACTGAHRLSRLSG